MPSCWSKLNFKKYFVSSGFTLVEVMVSGAIIGVVALGITSIVRTQASDQKTIESRFEISILMSDLAQHLQNSDGCLNTFKALGNLKNLSATPPIVVPAIRNRKNSALEYEIGKVYGSGTIRISNMTISDFDYKPKPIPPGGEGYSEFVLMITLQKTSSLIQGNRELIKRIPIRVNLDDNYTVKECHSAENNAIETALTIHCQSMGGMLDPATHDCTLTSYTSPPSPIDSYTVVSTKYLSDALTDLVDGTYVKTTGDTMTGNLTISNADLNALVVKSNTTFCVDGGGCRDFTQKTCSTGATQAINANGSLSCSNNCSTGQYVSAVNSSNNFICNTFPDKDCPTGQYISNITSSGAVTCSSVPSPSAINCGSGKYLKEITTAGTGVCRSVMIDTNTNVFNRQCPSGYFVKGFNTNGSPICVQPCPCGVCGTTRTISTTCSLGTPQSGTEICSTTGWVVSTNPWCYCPCGTCGAYRSVGISCSIGTPQYGKDQCRTSGWVRVTNPSCYCTCGTCGATRTWTSGTTVYRQICKTNGWVYY